MPNIENKYKNIKIFVYCGGKCGSTTLTTTFEQYYKTMHVHSDEEFKKIKSKQSKYSIFDVIEYNKKTQDKIYIIDSYRTPIERKMAGFFNNIHKLLPNYKQYKLRDLIHYYNSKQCYTCEEYHSIDEIMNYYKLPLFESFDFEKKYNLLVHENIHFIKIRFNDIKNWSEILTNIFNMPIKIKSDNLSETKSYATLYENFKKIYYVPNKYYTQILPNDKHFKIFNTEEEQKKYFEKWKERLLPGK
jgi:hypothetical protein